MSDQPKELKALCRRGNENYSLTTIDVRHPAALKLISAGTFPFQTVLDGSRRRKVVPIDILLGKLEAARRQFKR